MAIVGFDFTKISAERSGNVKGKVNIKNNVSIKKVEKASLSLGTAKQTGLRFNFEFTAVYEPSIGNITINGEIIDMLPEDKVTEIYEKWTKDKKVEQAVLGGILNSILGKCNIQALIMSRDIGLPPPIPLPKMGSKDAAK